MVLGIGCDIIEIARIEESIGQVGFLERYFTQKEIDIIESRGVSGASVAAANFCAKEAVVKAFGTGFGDISARDIEVLRSINGAPYVVLHEAAFERFREMGAHKVSVSLSHSGGVAMAFVVID